MPKNAYRDDLVIGLARERLAKLDTPVILEGASASNLAIISLLGRLVENGSNRASKKSRAIQGSPWVLVVAGLTYGLLKFLG